MAPADPQTARVTNFIRFNADDWRALAMCARIAQAQAEDDASKQSNPGIRDTFQKLARQRKELAERCENAARVL